MRRLMLATVLCSCAVLVTPSSVPAQEDTAQVELVQTVEEGVLGPRPPEDEASVYMSVKDSEGNRIEGGAAVAGREGMIRVHKVDHTVSLNTMDDEYIHTNTHGEMTVVKEADKSTPLLFEALTTFMTLQEVTLTFYRPQQSGGAEAVYEITMEEVHLASIETRGTTPAETVSMYYGRITWTWLDGNLDYTDITKHWGNR